MNPTPLTNAEPDAPTPPPSTPPAPAQSEEPKSTSGGSAATATQPAKPKTPPVFKPLEQYKVLLHNDDVNEMVFVVQSIVEVVPMPAEKAFTVMVEAHKSGVALVTVTHLELAELYRERFQSKGLCATIEKA